MLLFRFIACFAFFVGLACLLGLVFGTLAFPRKPDAVDASLLTCAWLLVSIAASLLSKL